MTVHSTQLAVGSVANATETTIYTAPSGKRVIVKSITILSAQSAAVAVAIVIIKGGGGSGTLHAYCTAFGTNGDTAILSPWIVLNAGDSVAVIFGSSGGWYTASGAELIV